MIIDYWIFQRNLDLITGDLVKNFSESTDYFKILVNVFSDEFRTNKNMHLRNFYIILPSLVCSTVLSYLKEIFLVNKKYSLDIELCWVYDWLQRKAKQEE